MENNTPEEMQILDGGLDPDQMESLCETAIDLMKELSVAYGPTRGLEMFEKLNEVLGDDIRANIIIKMLSGSSLMALNVRFVMKPDNYCVNKIMAIKSVRHLAKMSDYTLMDLKEAKDIVDGACMGKIQSVLCSSHEDRRVLAKELISLNFKVF